MAGGEAKQVAHSSPLAGEDSESLFRQELAKLGEGGEAAPRRPPLQLRLVRCALKPSYPLPQGERSMALSTAGRIGA